MHWVAMERAHKSATECVGAAPWEKGPHRFVTALYAAHRITPLPKGLIIAFNKLRTCTLTKRTDRIEPICILHAV